MQCLPQREKWVIAVSNGNVNALVEETKLSEGHGLKGVPSHGIIVECCSRSRMSLKTASKHMGNIMVQVRWRLRGESRISKVIVSEIGVVSKLIEKALKPKEHSPSSKFVLPSSSVAGDTGGVFLALAGMKTGADQHEVGDRRKLKSVQIGDVLGSPFRGS